MKVQNAQNEALTTVSTVKREYEKKQAELQSSIDTANEREQQAQKQIDEESALINALAESKVSGTKASLKRKYEDNAAKQEAFHNRRMKKLESNYWRKAACLYILTFSGILYSSLVTVFTALNSPRFSADIFAACLFVGGFFSALLENASVIAVVAWSLHSKIPYTVIDTLVPGLLAILGFLSIFCGILILVGLGLYKIGKLYADFFADNLSILVALVSFAFLVWFADSLTFITWNLIVVFIIIHVIYVFIRMLLTSFKGH